MQFGDILSVWRILLLWLVSKVVYIRPDQAQQQVVLEAQLECPQTPPPASSSDFTVIDSFGPEKRYVMQSLRTHEVTPNTLPTAEVGHRNSVAYTVCVYTHEKLACEQPLDTTNLFFFPFPTFINESVYTLDRGGVTSRIPEIQNPFYFIPWFHGFVKIKVEGNGCGRNWNFDHLLRVNGAHVQLLTDSNSTFCPSKPSIQDGKLRWANEDDTGCGIQFDVRNLLSRPASFGVVNLITKARNYLVIDGQQILFLETDSTVLDAFWNHELEVYEIANPRTNGRLKTWGSTTLEFKNSPSTIVGSGKWSAPGNKTGNYTSVGFQYRFMTFVLQDWDETEDPNVKQIPIGRDKVVEWEILAQANLIDGSWEVDDVVSRLIQPPTSVPKPPFFCKRSCTTVNG